tara:strand:- start:1968 stop:2741 length:774 start_codon:yes stop_codon:yes gene_type:complete
MSDFPSKEYQEALNWLNEYDRRLYKEAYGVNPKTPQDAKDFRTMSNVRASIRASTRDPREEEHSERKMNVWNRMNEDPNAGMFKFLSAPADNTGVAHDNIDGILAENKARTLADNIRQSGSIGPTPFAQTDEGQEALLELAMGSAMPGTAIGRVSKASVTGGQIAKEALNKMIKGGKPKPQIPYELAEEWDQLPAVHSKLEQIKWNNKINASRLAKEKAFDKYGLPHQRGNPSYPVERLPLMDSISELLHALKFRKN